LALKVMGVDPGYAACGMAAVGYGVPWGYVFHTTERDGTPADRVRMVAAAFEKQLEGFMSVCDEVVVGVEAFTYQHTTKRGGFNAGVARHMVALIERIRVICEMRDVPVYEITTVQAKAALGLKGKVSKARVKRAASAFLGIEVTEHIADACAVAIATERKHREQQIASSVTRARSLTTKVGPATIGVAASPVSQPILPTTDRKGVSRAGE